MIGGLSAGAGGGGRRGRPNGGDRPDILPSDEANGGSAGECYLFEDIHLIVRH